MLVPRIFAHNRPARKLRLMAALDSEIEKHKNTGLSASFMCGGAIDAVVVDRLR